MSAAVNRVFRVERANMESEGQPSIITDNSAQERHDEVMGALASLREHIDPQEAISQKVIDACQRDLQEALKIKSELQEIHDAISRTKLEIATLHRGEHQGIEVGRMTNELDAIVSGTEQATENILEAAEQIDSNAADLVAALRKEANHNTALDIQDQVIKIFEACNFQDLTGQRITKVVKAFCFIEERVHHMMEIWGGLESFQNLELDASCTRDADEALLNGPSLEEDEDIASQDDIDALFD
jgi:chemotaxis protein CheZ